MRIDNVRQGIHQERRMADIRMRIGRRIVAGLLLVAMAAPIASADPFQNPKANIPPQAKPQRRNAGEGMAPLPLPATPLRRSEKKREPAPPALVGSITFS